MHRHKTLFRTGLLIFAVLLISSVPASAQASSFEALYLSATGWVAPGQTYPTTLNYSVSPSADSATVKVVLSEYSQYMTANPAPTSGTGTAGDPLTWNVAPASTGKIIVWARALDLVEEPTMIWRDLSATGVLESTLGGIVQETLSSTTLGPKCTELESARYGVRRFPLVMVEYQDVTHCTGEGDPFPECTGDHTAEKLDEAVNSRTSGQSLWQLFQDMSFGQLSPEGQVGPAPNSPDEAYDPTYPYKWSTLQPSGTCTGATTAPPSGEGVPLSPRGRIEDGWYVLPGTQNYYGADATGHGLVGFVSGGLLLNIDDACGPTGKIAYDAAAIADQDLDYNLFDSDRDGLVDFMNVAFAGDGGNGNVTATGINNVWPHKSDLQYYFTDANGETGYVSNDQLRNHVDELMYWTDADRDEMTTTDTGIPVFVRVGPYNVNPESAIDAVSVVAHEYGHSLGLPDFYSLGGRETFGSWELMASDHFQFMTVFTRQDMGWIVPRPATDGSHTLRESKIDTGEIHWETPDGSAYTLTGPGIHNADALRVDLPKVLVIEEVPSGTRAFHSGSGNEFGCSPEAGHNLDLFLPELKQHAGASNIELSFQSLYEIEWDWDFAFLTVSTDGINWQALPSLENTTLDGFNPNNWECYNRYGHGITGVSRTAAAERNLLSNPDRYADTYREAEWITDRFDLSAFAGEDLVVRFTYFTDPAVAKRGWFIDDIEVTADGQTVYSSDLEGELDHAKYFSTGWSHVSTSTGRDVDHAYFIEVRDRVSNDFDSKGQSDRGAPTWQPGVAILYTDENHGYGNTGVDNPPAQTILDSTPDPGNDTPNLDDAAFLPEAGRDVFDGCTHIDNYDNPSGDHPDGLWKLPEGMRMTVTGIGGLSTDGTATGNAAADLLIDVDPDCSFLQDPPVLAFGAGHQDPDPDGSYELTWTRPLGAIGPDVLQEATVLADLFADDAESGMGNWTVETFSDQGCSLTPADFIEWQQNTGKFESPTFSFFTAATETAYGDSCADFHSTMTTASPISVPAAGGTVLSFWDSFGGELDDKGAVEVSTDNGASWMSVYDTANPVFAEATVTFLEEPVKYKEVDLTEFAGEDILIRFNYSVGASNYVAYAPIGWWVDDVTVSTANWTTIAEVDATAFIRSGRTDGTYHYRVKTRFPGSPVSVDSPWSNIVTTEVERTTSNTDPVANDDSATTDEDTAVTIDLLANDSDPDGDSLTVSSVTQPLNGMVVDNGDGTVTYTPNPGFSGNDGFSYTVSDGNGGSDSASVVVTVEPAPENQDPNAVDDSATTDENTAVTINVLANDSDPDGDSLTVSGVNQPFNGMVVDNGDGTITYTPNPGYSGNDGFGYTISDGNGGSDSASVAVTVEPAPENQDPNAVNDSATTDENTAVTINVLANDSDPDGDSLTVSAVTQPANGMVTNNGDGTVTYTPDAGFTGNDAFTYTVSDGNGGSASASVTVTVNSTNNEPTAENDFATTDEDTAVVINVLANDSDPDGDSLTVSAVSQPAHGVAGVNPDGTITYMPDPDFFGADAFTYTVSDGRGGEDHATVSINVRATGDDPGGDDDSDSDSDSDSDDADSDGIPNEEDSDDDNDGDSDSSDSDDDGDGIDDEFDDSDRKDKKSKRKGNNAAPNVQSSYTMKVEEGALLLTALVESPQAEALTVTIHDPAGNLMATSISTSGRSLVTAIPAVAGDYTVTVTNTATSTVTYDLTLLQRVPWPDDLVL